MANPSVYAIGGTVQASGGLYIARQADDELMALCRAGTFAYVLTPRQLGKSSLMVRTANQLAEEGIRSVMIDLTQMGVQVSAEAWYLGLLAAIEDQLGLETHVVEWWDAHAHLGLTQRLTIFFREVLLVEVSQPVVVFVDEIDTTLRLSFTDDFYAAIRYFYNARANVPEFQRLSFVLIGVAAPGDLIRDPQRTPFNIGQRVDLTDFTFEEALPLAGGLGLPAQKAQQVLGWVLKWTHGHPYLTVRLCRMIAEASRNDWSESEVDQFVEITFFGEKSEKDDNLQFVLDMLTKRVPASIDVGGILNMYGEIRRGRHSVFDEEQSLVKSHLKLSGVVRREGPTLRVRNPIYAKVFDSKWIKEHWPASFRRRRLQRLVAVAAVITLVTISISALGILVLYAQDRAQEADWQRRIALSRQLAAQAYQFLPEQLDLALLLGVEAYDGQLETKTFEALSVLLTGLTYSPQLRTFLYRGSINSMAFTPDGKTLAVGGCRDEFRGKPCNQGEIRFWDVTTFQSTGLALTGHTDTVTGVAFSPDGKTLASWSLDTTVIFWDTATRQPLGQPLRGHAGAVSTAAFSPDGKILASGGCRDNSPERWCRQGEIRLWDVLTHQPVGQPLVGHNGSVRSVAFSPDGKVLASGSDDKTIILWDAATGQPLDLSLEGHQFPVLTVAFRSDGKELVSGGLDNTIILWDVARRQRLKGPYPVGTARVGSVAFGPDEKTVALGSQDGSISLWDLVTGRRLGQPLIGHSKNAITGMAFARDGKTLASRNIGGQLILWSVAASQPLGQFLKGHTVPVSSVAFSPDGKILASGGCQGDTQDEPCKQGEVYLWDVATRRRLDPPFFGHADVRYLAFSPDGTMLALGGYNSIVLWDVATRKPLSQLLTGYSTVSSVAFSQGGTLASGGCGRLELEDNSGNKVCNQGEIRLWNAATRQPLGQPLRGHAGAVSTAAFSPDGKILASGGCRDNSPERWCRQGEIRLWDVLTHQPVGQPLVGHNDSVRSVAFSPDGKVLASGSQDSTITLWDLTTRRPLHQHLQVGGDDVSVAFSPDSKILVSGSRRGVILWDVATGQLIGQPLTGHTDQVNSVAYSPDGNTLASGYGDGTIILWEVSFESWTRRACDLAKRNLTYAEWKIYRSDKGPYSKTCSDTPVHPSFIEAGRDLARAGDMKGAVAFFQQATRLDRDSNLDPKAEAKKSEAEGLVAKARNLAMDVDGDGAIASLQQAMKLDPGLNLAPGVETKKWAKSMVEKGERLARSGDVDGAVALFQQALKLDPGLKLDAKTEAKKWSTEGLLAEGKGLAWDGNIDGAVELFQKALTLDSSLPLDPQLEARNLAAQGRITRGERLVYRGKVKEALTAYAEALALDPKLVISAGSWNDLCWVGSLHGYAEDVMKACEQAVALDPANGAFRDSHGLARALIGKFDGVIEDFEAFVNWTQDEEKKLQRQRWIEAIHAGKNPFTPEEIERLRGGPKGGEAGRPLHGAADAVRSGPQP